MLQDLEAVIRGGSVVGSRHKGRSGERRGGCPAPAKSTVCSQGRLGEQLGRGPGPVVLAL